MKRPNTTTVLLTIVAVLLALYLLAMGASAQQAEGPTGSCCFPDGGCSTTTLAQCLDNGGVFYESGPDNEYMISQSADVPQVADFPETVVPADHCFVLGDNRGRSRDSRHFGFIPIADVIGGVRYIFSPAESWARFGSFDG